MYFNLNQIWDLVSGGFSWFHVPREKIHIGTFDFSFTQVYKGESRKFYVGYVSTIEGKYLR